MIRLKKITAFAVAASMMLTMSSCNKQDEHDTELTTVDIQTEDDASSSDANIDVDDLKLSAYSQPDPTGEDAEKEQAEFEQYLDESFDESVTSDSITLHYTLADPEGYGVTRPDPTFGNTDTSEEQMAQDKSDTKDDLEELREFDYDLLTSDQKFTYDILENELETNLEFYDYTYLYEPFAYTSGLHSNLPVTMSEYNFYNVTDVEDYIALLNLIPDYIQSYLDFEKVKSNKGYFMNENSANEVIRQCNEFIAKPEQNLLIETFNDRIGDVPDITDEQIETFKQENYDAVINSVIPAYENIISTFKALKGTQTNDLGLAYYEDGQDYYKYMLKNDVGTDKTPEEIIDILDNKLDDVMSEYQTVAMANYEAYTDYYEDSDDLYGDLDPEETIKYFEDVFADKFPEIPDIDFTVTPVHESLEDIVSPAFFMTPPLDKYDENTIHTNLTSDGAGGIWNTLAHEGVPGHMYQFVYYLSQDPEPLRYILNFSGYQEGWATYVELMSFDYYDGYDDPSYADFERINNELNLLVSARVEIGVNYEGWTLEDTEDYLNNNGFNGDAAEDIMDYVIAEPANYQMYVMGWLSFEELKTETEDALGDDFDEQEFHKVVLDAGPCQFYLLEKLVDDYIIEKTAN